MGLTIRTMILKNIQPCYPDHWKPVRSSGGLVFNYAENQGYDNAVNLSSIDTDRGELPQLIIVFRDRSIGRKLATVGTI